jgi:hypothetical protein
MLPRMLCEELCSLNPMTDKLTFSVIWTLTPEGKVTTYMLLFMLFHLSPSHSVSHGKHHYVPVMGWSAVVEGCGRHGAATVGKKCKGPGL